MWFDALLFGVIGYLSWDVSFHGPVLRTIVSVFGLFFTTNRDIGRALGVKYFRSDTWETTRANTHLLFPAFGVFSFLGIQYEFGNEENIRALKARQSGHTREINLTQHIQALVNKRLNLTEIEDFLVHTWLSEITEVYNITPPEDTETYVRGMKAMRMFFALRQTELFSSLWYLWSRREDFLALRRYLIGLPKDEERVIMLITLLTTIDSSLYNLITDPRPINEFRDLFRDIPVGSVVVRTGGRLGICDIVTNEADNPGNSIFGPKGLICPGNRITSMVLKSVANLKKHFVVKVEGKPELRPGSAQKIWNPEDVFVTFLDAE